MFVCLTEAPLYVIPIPGSGGVSAVLGGASSSEPRHLQREDPGAHGCSEEAAAVRCLSGEMSCLVYLHRGLRVHLWIILYIYDCICYNPVCPAISAPIALLQKQEPSLCDPEDFLCMGGWYSWPPVLHLCNKGGFSQCPCLDVGLFFQS